MIASRGYTGGFGTVVLRTGGRLGAATARKVLYELKMALRTTSGRIGLPIVLFFLILAFFGAWLAPYSATDFQYVDLDVEIPQIRQLEAPSSRFWLGTDEFGRDILSRLMTGARSIMFVSFVGALLGLTMGTIVGMSSGYTGGKTDEVVMRVMDGLLSFPSLLLALLVLTTLGGSSWNIIMTIGIVFTPGVSRVVRSSTLALKELEFVQSARLRGENAPYIIFRELLPNIMQVLAVEASVRLSYAVLLASSLGFLGLGVQPPSPDWGRMIAESRGFIVDHPLVALAPAISVAVLIIGVNLLADGIRQARGLPRGVKKT